MTGPFLIVLIGAIAVIVFDVIGSFLSRSLGFRYAWLTIGSVLIYASVGLFASQNSFVAGVLASSAVGLVDATIGWYLSWIIGPGKPQQELSASAIFTGVMFVSLLAGAMGFLGAAAGRLATA